MADLVERFTEISRRDDCFDHMVPSDVREMLGEITLLRASLGDLVTWVGTLPVKHPQQAVQRDVARALLRSAR